MAERLSGVGLPVTLAVDALATHCVQTADLVLVGVDSATPTGVVSKVGTSGLALAAARWDVPLYALAETSKVWPAALGDPVIRERSPEEVWADAPADIGMLNRYFDVTDWSGVSGLVTEDGILSGDEVADRSRRLKVSKELVAIYEGVRQENG